MKINNVSIVNNEILVARGNARCITQEEIMIEWFRKERMGKLTSYMTVCEEFCLMGDMRGVLQGLVDTGKIRKLKNGYRVNKESSNEG